MASKLIIGLSGEIASGKGTAADHLCSGFSASKHTISGILSDILKRLYLPADRKYLQALGTTIRKELGHDVIINTLEKDIEKDRAKIVILDGVRYMNEVEMIHGMGGIVVYIGAPQKVRYERCRGRAQKGEGGLSFEQFAENEKKETERQVGEVKMHADYVIDNSGTVDELFFQIDKILKGKGIII
ncbi:MAG: hypothetical protein MSIBF_04200 [Candidatus Altiarchaeales archaeon IMC4]|nr:MAG: hypothetical protein MSIBF_04200 [Candidatus Altiarchaeales archaeon IMC4]